MKTFFFFWLVFFRHHHILRSTSNNSSLCQRYAKFASKSHWISFRCLCGWTHYIYTGKKDCSFLFLQYNIALFYFLWNVWKVFGYFSDKYGRRNPMLIGINPWFSKVTAVLISTLLFYKYRLIGSSHIHHLVFIRLGLFWIVSRTFCPGNKRLCILGYWVRIIASRFICGMDIYI